MSEDYQAADGVQYPTFSVLGKQYYQTIDINGSKINHPVPPSNNSTDIGTDQSPLESLGPDAKASDRYAAITREQWDNYKQYGIPQEDKLIGMIDNEAGLQANLASAQNRIRTSGDVSASETNRSLSQYGVAPTAAQQQTNDRLNKLTTTASMADARNFVRQEHLDLGQTILNGAPNAGLDTIAGGN